MSEVQITVRYFAAARAAAGIETETLSVPAGTTVGGLVTGIAGRGPEQARMVPKDLHRVANARKAFAGQYQGLLDPAVLARKAEQERDLQSRVAANPTLARVVGQP